MLMRLRPGFGCEIFDLPVGGMGQSSQYLPQVSSRVDPTTTAAFHDGVQDRAAITGFGFADKQPVALADGSGTDGIFYAEVPIMPRRGFGGPQMTAMLWQVLVRSSA